MGMDPLGSLRLDDFLDRLGSKEPVPGGGAAAGVTGAIGAALALMVVEYSVGRKAAAQHEAALSEIRGSIQGLRSKLMSLADADAEAYAALSGLWGVREDPARADEWADALRRAIEVPTRIMEVGEEALGLCERLAPICNRNLLSDLAGSAALFEACVRAAGQNVRVNAGMLKDRVEAESILADLAARRARAHALRERVERACGS